MPEPFADDLHRVIKVPLFPLPNVVLFPRAILPLHIFEARYKSMVADALNGAKLIAIALLRPGWEKNYNGPASIEPVVCIGQIMAHERLADGKYNLLLQGMRRAKVIDEDPVEIATYRTAKVQPLSESHVMEIDMVNHRRQLVSLFSNGRFASEVLSQKFSEMLCSTLPTADIADLIAFNFLDETNQKQQLLSEPDPYRRVERILSILETMQTLPPLADRTDSKSDLN